MGKRLFLALTLVLAACGDSAVTTPTVPDAPGFPVEIGSFTVEAPPQRILSGSPTHTEILFAVGAGGQVVAVDDFSDHPLEVETLPHLDMFNPNVEAIAGFEPDLVVLVFDPGEVVDALAALGIPAIVLDAPVDLVGVYAQIEFLGDLTGHSDEARDVTARMADDIDKIVSDLPEMEEPLTYYHELGPDLYSIGSDTFLGSIYGLLGLVSIGDEAGGGFPQLSAEFIIEADPDFIFLGDATCCGQTPEVVAERPGWDQLSAVQEERVLVVDESLSSRWGPRIVDLLRILAEQLAENTA